MEEFMKTMSKILLSFISILLINGCGDSEAEKKEKESKALENNAAHLIQNIEKARKNPEIAKVFTQLDTELGQVNANEVIPEANKNLGQEEVKEFSRASNLESRQENNLEAPGELAFIKKYVARVQKVAKEKGNASDLKVINELLSLAADTLNEALGSIGQLWQDAKKAGLADEILTLKSDFFTRAAQNGDLIKLSKAWATINNGGDISALIKDLQGLNPENYLDIFERAQNIQPMLLGLALQMLKTKEATFSSLQKRFEALQNNPPPSDEFNQALMAEFQIEISQLQQFGPKNDIGIQVPFNTFSQVPFGTSAQAPFNTFSQEPFGTSPQVPFKAFPPHSSGSYFSSTKKSSTKSGIRISSTYKRKFGNFSSTR